MHHRRLVPVTLVVLLMGAWLAGPSYAVELAGPVTSTAPGACSADAAIFSLPASLLSAESTPATTPVMVCGCGDAVCVGKAVNAHCGIARFCQVLGVCSIATPGKQCGCLAPP
jgi:hypothetical protein